MRIGFPAALLLFLIFCAWLRYELHKKRPHDVEDFMARERKANQAPAKSLSELNYITIPLDKLPFGCISGHTEVDHMEYTIRNLARPDRKIVNLTGYTNTDLKFMYGKVNLPALTKYDAAYITLVTTLNDWAQVLYNEGMFTEAAIILEFSVSTGSDITAGYHMLCDIYTRHMDLSGSERSEKIDVLKSTALSLRSANRNDLVAYLDTVSK